MLPEKRPILVAVGDSDPHDAALRFGADEAVRARIEAALVPQRADHPRVDVRVELVHVRPADAVVERPRRTDLLVLGRSLASPGSSHLGSVTRAALREASCPAAVVDAVAPSPADPSEARQTAGAS
jgi:nucleotide-binding universal stress UspA family protein